MRILWVNSGGLLPLDRGGKIRSYHLLRQLARKHETTLFTFYPECTDDQHCAMELYLTRLVRMPLRVAPRGSLWDCAKYLRNLLSIRPYSITKDCRPEVSRNLRQVLESQSYDLIICDFLFTAAVIPWHSPVPKIIFTHNVEAMIWKRQYEVSNNLVWKAVSWREYLAVTHTERSYLKRADHVLTVSDTDRDLFSTFLDPDRITVVPTGVDVDYFRPSEQEEEPGTLVFVGSMDWSPNEDGIIYFAEEILPRIRAKIPSTSLVVVGRLPSKRLSGMAARHGIMVTGRVDDVRSYVNRSAVYVVPLRIGGGTRIKIFEAMAMGKAVVSTSIGAEGLPVQHGRDIMLADDAEEFAARVIMLLRDANLRRTLGRAARCLVAASYGWDSAADILNSVAERVVLEKIAATLVPANRLSAKEETRKLNS